MNNSTKKYFQIQKVFVFIFIVILLLPINIYATDSVQRENILERYIINPISQIFLPWFSPRENTNTVIIKTENVSTSSPREAETLAKTPLTINYSGISKEEVSRMITGAISALPTPIQNYYPSTYVTGSSGSTQGVANALGRNVNTLQTNIDNLSSSVSSILTAPSITGEASFASSLLLSQISAPSDTSNRLYNTGGDLYWAGNLVGGGSVGNWTLSGSDVYRSSGNVGIGTTSPYRKFSVVGSGVFTGGDVLASTFTATSSISSPSLILSGTALNSILSTNSIGSIVATSTPTFGNFNATSTTATSTLSTGGLAIGGSQFVVQQNSGNVGIGTTGPNYKIEIVGTANIADRTLGINGTPIIYLPNSVTYLNSLALGNGLRNITTGAIENTAVGINALLANTEGHQNTAVGTEALSSNTIGNNNAAFGGDAMQFNTEGINNSAFGAGAMNFNTTGSHNTAIGVNGLYANTLGANNTAVGEDAIYANTTGTGNSAIGYQALYSNTTGSYNIASGYQALYSNTTGLYNIGIGKDALRANTTANNNIGIGVEALLSNTTGAGNTAIGLEAMRTNTNRK
ncbi:MAG: hypothetical protein AAB350_01350 [Patescibacteria group bacterium]